MKRILVIGGTGAMGTYLVPLLAKSGYSVTVIANDAVLPADYENVSGYVRHWRRAFDRRRKF